MPIEQNTFNQIVNLVPQDILDLIQTVCTAAILSPPLAVSPNDKIVVACVMLNHANAMLEQCGCKINTTISNPKWINDATHETKTGNEEDIL